MTQAGTASQNGQKVDSYESLGLTVKNGADMASMMKTGVTGIFYGDTGVGKTHAVRFLPDKETLYVGLEGGDSPLEGKDIPIFNLELENDGQGLAAFSQIMRAIRDGETIANVDTSQLKFLVIDHISEMERFFQFGLMRNRKKRFLELKEYGDTSQKMREYLRMMRDLRSKGINVVFFAHEMWVDMKEDGVPVTKVVPKVGKSIVQEVMGMVDIVGRMEIATEEDSNGAREVRRIRIKKASDVAAKCRWTEMYRQHGDYASQDLGELYREVYKIRKARSKNT